MFKKIKNNQTKLFLFSLLGLSLLFVFTISTILIVKKVKQNNSSNSREQEKNKEFLNVVNDEKGNWYYRVNLKEKLTSNITEVKAIFKNLKDDKTIEIKNSNNFKINDKTLFYDLNDFNSFGLSNWKLVSLENNLQFLNDSSDFFSNQILNITHVKNDKGILELVLSFNANMNDQKILGNFEYYVFDKKEEKIKIVNTMLNSTKVKDQNIFKFDFSNFKEISKFTLTQLIKGININNKFINSLELNKFNNYQKSISNFNLGQIKEEKLIIDFDDSKFLNLQKTLENKSNADFYVRLKNAYNQLIQIPLSRKNNSFIASLTGEDFKKGIWKTENIFYQKEDENIEIIMNDLDFNESLKNINVSNQKPKIVLKDYSLINNSDDYLFTFNFEDEFYKRNKIKEVILELEEIETKNKISLKLTLDDIKNSLIGKLSKQKIKLGEYKISNIIKSNLDLEIKNDISNTISLKETSYKIIKFDKNELNNKMILTFQLNENPKKADDSEFTLIYKENNFSPNKKTKTLYNVKNENLLIFEIDDLKLGQNYIIDSLSFDKGSINKISWDLKEMETIPTFNIKNKKLTIKKLNSFEDKAIDYNNGQIILEIENYKNERNGKIFEIEYLNLKTKRKYKTIGYSNLHYSNQIVINFEKLMSNNSYSIINIKTLSNNSYNTEKDEYILKNNKISFETKKSK